MWRPEGVTLAAGHGRSAALHEELQAGAMPDRAVCRRDAYRVRFYMG